MTQTEEKITFEQMPQLLAELKGAITSINDKLDTLLENGETDLFNRIKPRFDSHRGTLVGVRHFSEPTCNCEICSNHSKQ